MRRSGTGRKVVAVAAAWVLASVAARAQLGPMPAPPENPVTPQKAVLGKILYWDEQLSSDNTMACGTCHQPRQGGADPKWVRTAGPDAVLHTPDDQFGSPAMRLADSFGQYKPSAYFGMERQVTGRVSPEFMAAGYFTTLFWDGRAPTTFVDPLTGLQLIKTGGALESQLVQPPVSSGEMAHEGRDWNDIVKKIGRVRPLALASNFPPDVVSALAASPTYPALFAAAYGNTTITVERIAFAIATYERSLAPRRTLWDQFMLGNTTKLSPAQQRGWALFTGKGRCNLCHIPPLFADDLFHNVGVRPWQEDAGLMNVTGNFADRGLFRTPTLRNSGLRRRWMHNGRFGDMNHVLDMYVTGGDFTDNLDPLIIPLNITPLEKMDLYDFVVDGLTDPDIRDEKGIYARPTLHSEQSTTNPTLIGAPTTGSSGYAPVMVAEAPPNLGNDGFKLGVNTGRGGAVALLAIGPDAALPGANLNGIPLYVSETPLPYLIPLVLNGAGDGQGFATVVLPLSDDPSLAGQDWYAQWFIDDPAAIGSWSTTAGAQLVLQQ